MSHAGLRAAIEAAKKAMESPLIVAIAAASSSPSQALLQAQNRGLSNDEQTWCRLLAKAMRLAKDMGMDALSILPSTIQNSKEYNMNRNKAEVFMELAKNYVVDYNCANVDGVGGNQNEKEIMMALLLMNEFSRLTNGEISIEMVKEFLTEGHDEAILLLIGDERVEAKNLLIDCIINSDFNKLFYESPIWGKHFYGRKVLKQKIGPILVLISTNLELFFSNKEGIFLGAGELLALVSGQVDLENCYSDEGSALLSMLWKHEYFRQDKFNMLAKFTRAFLAETWFWQTYDVVECSELNIDTLGRMSYLGHDGETKTFDFLYMNDDAYETYVIISDQENLKSRLKALLEAFNFPGISEGDDVCDLIEHIDKLAEFMNKRDRR